MPMALQAKLLRALQEKAVTPIGSQTDIPVDVRVVATTNRNMAEKSAPAISARISIIASMSSRSTPWRWRRSR